MLSSVFQDLFLQNPLLAITAVHMAGSQSALAGVKYIPPEQQPEKFKKYAQTLGMKKSPPILLVPDSFTHDALGEGAKNNDYYFAYYSGVAHAIILPEKFYKAFTDMPRNESSDYVVAHEMGHARNRISRRKVINGMAAGAMGMSASIMSNNWVQARADDVGITHPNKRSIADIPTGITSGGLGLAFGAITAYGIMTLLSQGARHEELTADQYAIKILGLSSVAYAQASNALQLHPESGEISKLANELYCSNSPEKMAAMTPEEDALLKALCVLEAIEKHSPLQKIDKNTYPTHAHRLQEMGEQMRQALGKNEAGRA